GGCFAPTTLNLFTFSPLNLLTSSPLPLLDHPPHIDPPRLLAHVDACDFLQGGEVDDVDGAGLGADALVGDERVAVVGGDGDAARDFAGGGDPRELVAGRDVDDGYRLTALVRPDEELAVARGGEVVDAVPGGNAACHRPRRDVDLDDVVRLVA